MSTSESSLAEGRPRRRRWGLRSRRGGRRWCVAKTVPRTRPSASTIGPPELPLRTAPRREADRAPDRPAAVGVLADHVARFAEAGRRRSRRGRCPGSRGRRRLVRGWWIGATGSGGRSARAAQDARSLLGVVVDRRRVEGGAVPGRDRGVVLAGDDVGVGDDQAGRGDPARALDPEPAGRAQHADHRAAGRLHVGIAGDPLVGRRRPASAGPMIEGAGSTRSSALSTGPDGGSRSLRLRRISERCTSPRRCAVPGACRATAPKTQTTPSATQATSAAPPAPSARCRRCGRGSPRSRRPRAMLSRVTATSAPTSSAPSAASSGA